jgi:hypothetical protein
MTKVETTASVPKAPLSTLEVNVIPRINSVLRKKPLKAVDFIFNNEKKNKRDL